MARLDEYIDLSQYPNLTPEHKDVLREMMRGATDEDAPLWFRAHCTTVFELLASGCERIEEVIQQAKMSGVRGNFSDYESMGYPADDLADLDEAS